MSPRAGREGGGITSATWQFDSQAVHSVARCYAYYALLAHVLHIYTENEWPLK